MTCKFMGLKLRMKFDYSLFISPLFVHFWNFIGSQLHWNKFYAEISYVRKTLNCIDQILYIERTYKCRYDNYLSKSLFWSPLRNQIESLPNFSDIIISCLCFVVEIQITERFLGNSAINNKYQLRTTHRNIDTILPLWLSCYSEYFVCKSAQMNTFTMFQFVCMLSDE